MCKKRCKSHQLRLGIAPPARFGRAMRRCDVNLSTSGASATGPLSQLAVKPPSHRADDPQSAQAPANPTRLVSTDRKGLFRRTLRMRCAATSALRLLLLSSQSHTRAGPFAVTTSHPVSLTQAQRPRPRSGSHHPRGASSPNHNSHALTARNHSFDVASCSRVELRSPVLDKADERREQEDASASCVCDPRARSSIKVRIKNSQTVRSRHEVITGSQGLAPGDRDDRDVASC